MVDIRGCCYNKAAMATNTPKSDPFPPDFHDHMMLTIVQKDYKVSNEFQISLPITMQQYQPDTSARIRSIAHDMLRNNINRLLKKRRTVCRIDATHSFMLQLEYETRLEIQGPILYCFSFRICPYSAKCREGLYIPEPGKEKREWEF